MLLFALSLVAVSPVMAEFEFQKGDNVVLIGNSLPERMQHDGWLETLIQSKEADKELVFRNQSFSGDQVTNRPRSQGFTPAEDYLKHSEADVIFVFFGYNESFAGDEGLEGFKNDLGTMVDEYRALKPNGKSEPRIVLFSPIAHEDLNDPNLPDGKENNERLAKYTAAIKEVAEAKKTGFVDLFEPSKVRYAASEAPLTINGVHLTEEGNRQMAEAIAEQLLGERDSGRRAFAGTAGGGDRQELALVQSIPCDGRQRRVGRAIDLKVRERSDERGGASA